MWASLNATTPADNCSGTVQNTQVSARKDGPRARIAYIVQCKNRRTADWHTVATLSLLTAVLNVVLTDFKALLSLFVSIFYQPQECHPGLPCPCQRMSRKGKAT